MTMGKKDSFDKKTCLGGEPSSVTSIGLDWLADLRGIPFECVEREACECEDKSDEAVFKFTPRVSVLVLAYNHGAYLRRALDGIVAQKTTFPFEVIVAEDCSTDATRAIALEYLRKYPGLIRVILSCSNIGCSSNLHRAFQYSRGDYIAYCEGDDFWHSENKIQRQVECLEAYPKVGLIFSGGRVETGRKVESVKGWGESSRGLTEGIIEEEEATRALINREWHPLTCTCMVRRDELVVGYGNNPLLLKKLALGDTLTWLEILQRKDAYFMDDSLGTQVIHKGSATDGLGREYVNRDSCMVLCYFAMLMGYERLIREHRVNVLKARLAIASALHNYAEITRVVGYCLRKGLLPGWQLTVYMALALLGGVDWGKRLRREQLMVKEAEGQNSVKPGN